MTDLAVLAMEMRHLPEAKCKTKLCKIFPDNTDAVNEVITIISILNDIDEGNEPESVVIAPKEKDDFEIFLAIKDLEQHLIEGAIASQCNNNQVQITRIYDLLHAQRLKESGADIKSMLQSSVSSVVNDTFNPDTLIDSYAGEYVLVKKIKTAGNSHIFLGYMSSNNGHFDAIKVIKPHINNYYNYGLIDREFTILKQFRHKYVIQVNDVGVIKKNGVYHPFYRMPYIENSTNILSDAFSKNASVNQRIQTIIKVCEGIEAAHSEDIKHLDLKPDNVLMDKHGDPLIIDFGIALRACNDNDILSHSTLEEKQAKYIEQIKSYAQKHSDKWSSPELLNGEVLTEQADIYALGVMLWQLVTGTSSEVEKFDIENNLPSKYFATQVREQKLFSVVTKKDTLFANELDAIILKAIAHNIKDRYSSVSALRSDLIAFLNYEEIEAENRGYIYNFIKLFKTKPKFAFVTSAAAGFGVIALTFAVHSYSLYFSQQADHKFINEINRNLVSFSTRKDMPLAEFYEATDDTFTRHEYVSDKTLLQASIDIAEFADNHRTWRVSSKFYDIALSVANAQRKKTIRPKLAKALYYQNKLDKAESIIDDVYESITDNNFDNVEDIISYLELLDFDTKYISSAYDDERADIEILESISAQWKVVSNLPLKYRAKLNYLLANEYYYSFYGGTFNPTDNFDDRVYQSEIRKVLHKAQNEINLAIFHSEKYDVGYYALRARINHELREYDEAKVIANFNYHKAVSLYGKNDRETDKALVAQYAVSRYTDLSAAISATQKYTDSVFTVSGEKDDWLYAMFIMSRAHLARGEFKKSQNALLWMKSAFERQKDTLVFKGLEGITAGFLTYLEFTNFDYSDEFYNQLIPTLLEVHQLTKQKYPQYIADYEYILFDLIEKGYKRNEEQTVTLIRQMLNKRAAGHQSAADELSQLALNASGMMRYFEQNEIALELANIAENSMVWSPLQQSHSTAKMMKYLQLADIYLTANQYEKYDNAMKEAEVVYRNHYNDLHNTPYAEFFKNSVVTKNYLK